MTKNQQRNARARERRRLHKLHSFERAAWERGLLLVGGVDEVGRGPLAGPVVAACVVLREPLSLDRLNDSKVLTAEVRERLAEAIVQGCVAYAVGEASVEEIDRLNIYRASMLAMVRAIERLQVAPNHLLIDALRLRDIEISQEPVIKGDARCASIAAASIVAKVHRDRLMVKLDQIDTRYGFAEHKGYSTRRHIEALETFGPSPYHRRSFLRVARQLALSLNNDDMPPALDAPP